MTNFDGLIPLSSYNIFTSTFTVFPSLIALAHLFQVFCKNFGLYLHSEIQDWQVQETRQNGLLEEGLLDLLALFRECLDYAAIFLHVV